MSVCGTSGRRRAERQQWVSGGEDEGSFSREFLCNKERVKISEGKQHKEEGSRISVLI